MWENNLKDEYRFQEVDEALDGLYDISPHAARDVENLIMWHYIPKPHDADGEPVDIGDYIRPGEGDVVKVYGIGMDYLADGPVVRVYAATGPWVTFVDGTKKAGDPRCKFLQEFVDVYNSTNSRDEELAVIDEFAKRGQGVFK